jgi:hypothetical protein
VDDEGLIETTMSGIYMAEPAATPAEGDQP